MIASSASRHLSRVLRRSLTELPCRTSDESR